MNTTFRSLVITLLLGITLVNASPVPQTTSVPEYCTLLGALARRVGTASWSEPAEEGDVGGDVGGDKVGGDDEERIVCVLMTGIKEEVAAVGGGENGRWETTWVEKSWSEPGGEGGVVVREGEKGNDQGREVVVGAVGFRGGRKPDIAKRKMTWRERVVWRQWGVLVRASRKRRGGRRRGWKKRPDGVVRYKEGGAARGGYVKKKNIQDGMRSKQNKNREDRDSGEDNDQKGEIMTREV
ncbi:hypothetical protein BDQ17DRAFT_1330362 [Cyathus striatus]|nr:hypothetical protein BDQ17DRAFT_1330362 [Cyathus striatus]